MNFISAFDELNKLYEDKKVARPRTKNLTEDAKANEPLTEAGKEFKCVFDQGTLKPDGVCAYCGTKHDPNTGKCIEKFCRMCGGELKPDGKCLYCGTQHDPNTGACTEKLCDCCGGEVDKAKNRCLYCGSFYDPKTGKLLTCQNSECPSPQPITADEGNYVCPQCLTKHDIKTGKPLTGKTESLAESDEEGFDDSELAMSDETVEKVNEPFEEEETQQIIVECDKCGALVIIDDADVVVDEETDLVNVEDACKFCEETAGYKIVGVVAPYEATEDTIEIEDDEAIEDTTVEESLVEAKMETQKTDALCSVVFDNKVQRFVGTRKECEDWIKSLKGPAASKLSIKDSANVVKRKPAQDSDEAANEEVKEDLADFARKVFDRPASIATQQNWEDQLEYLYLQLEDPNLADSKKARIKKEIAHLEAKFGQQRDWEERHANDDQLDELFDIKPSVSLSLDGGQGNDVDVL